ncbi:IPT/TIG domain-containing protein [Streptomyces sp. NPDC047718]|uniref:IPT/TIG domain-containing protein n=1 Tax=Streptomyces sp. NPDC047718 TaxID=3155479 RepID=UPI0033C309B0
MPISSHQGSAGGGTLVAITGTNLSGTTAVTFGTKPATPPTSPTSRRRRSRPSRRRAPAASG